MSLLQMSLSGAVLIAAVALARLAARRAVSRRTFVALWLVVLARLLIPFAPAFEVPLPALPIDAEPAAQVMSAAPQAESNLPAAVVPSTNVNNTTQTVYDSFPVPAAPTDAAEAPARAELPVWTLVCYGGTLMVGAAFALLYLLGCRRFRAAVPVESEAAHAWLDAHPLRRPLTIKTLSGLASPLTYGVLRPVILVPEGFDFAGEAARFALEHEYIHARRFDAALKPLLAAAVAVHWFNPAVWLMYSLANRDIELSCDEAVLRCFGEAERAPYARALLAMEEHRDASPVFCSSFGASPITERIESIMKYRTKSFFSLLLAGAMVLSLAACAATAGKTDGSTPTEDKTAPSAGGEAVNIYENNGMMLSIPEKYAGLLLVETPQDSEWGTLFSVSEKASVEAAEADGHGDWGMGGLFGISRITKAQLDEMMTADMSGAEIFAKDAQGNYYEFGHATDVRFYRPGMDSVGSDEDEWAQWETLNEWAWNDVREQFIADNGLTPFAVTNSGVDIYLARLACWDNVEYTLSNVAFGSLSPDGVDATPYVERLRNGVLFETVDSGQTPDGEYFALFFPDEGGGERFDFFAADGNYVRQVYGSSGEYQILYRATYADGTTTAGDIVREWYEALAGADRLANELGALRGAMGAAETNAGLAAADEPADVPPDELLPTSEINGGANTETNAGLPVVVSVESLDEPAAVNGVNVEIKVVRHFTGEVVGYGNDTARVRVTDAQDSALSVGDELYVGVSDWNDFPIGCSVEVAYGGEVRADDWGNYGPDQTISVIRRTQ